MNKLLILVGVLLVSFPAVLAQSTDYFIELEPAVFTFRPPSGSARITSVTSYSRPQSRVSVQTNNLRVPPGFIAQAWLVEYSNNYWLNLGKFRTSISGKGILNFRISHYISAYDAVVVTLEPLDDHDLHPSNTIALTGQLVEHYTARAAPGFTQIQRPRTPISGLGYGQPVYHLS